jgi:hypothetical protein
MKRIILWGMTLCSPLRGSGRFGETLPPSSGLKNKPGNSKRENRWKTARLLHGLFFDPQDGGNVSPK